MKRGRKWDEKKDKVERETTEKKKVDETHKIQVQEGEEKGFSGKWDAAGRGRMHG